MKLASTGAGIHVFHGDESVPTGTLPNNSFVISRPINYDGFRFRFACRSNTTQPEIIGLKGNQLPNTSMRFDVMSGAAGVLVSNNGTSGQLPITSDQQGVYTCHIPDLLINEGMIDINIGIYPNGFNSKHSYI